MSTDSRSLDGDASEADGVTAALPSDEAFTDDDGVLYDEEVTPEFGIIGFTLRELIIVGAWVALFVMSFLPLGWAPALWTQGISWLLPVGVPTVAVFLIVLRRFSPDGIRRVGSLGIDQFASVAFSVAAVWWAQLLWEYLAAVIATGMGGVFWVPWAQLVVALSLVALTVFAPLLPGVKEDFHGRLVTLAHRNANPVRPVIARPRAERPSTPADHGLAAPPTEVDGAPDSVGADIPAGSDTNAPAGGLDIELSGHQATDEVARIDLASQVPLASHASGGGTGTEQTTSDEQYAPAYSRRTWNQDPDVVYDTGSIESILGARAVEVEGPQEEPAQGEPVASEPVRSDQVTTAFGDSVIDDLDATNPREVAPATQPFWILAPTDRDVHDERGEAIFRIGPSAWALVIEDRGGAYVVRHDDGRIGYLHDIADITRG